MSNTSDTMIHGEDLNLNPFLKVKGSIISCSYCKRDISNQCRIKCAECTNYESCVDCFAAGAALLPHLSTHNYRISDCLDFPLFSKDWTAKEELLLLEGIEKFGAGNAKAIAEYMYNFNNSNKTNKQVEDRYWEHYLGIHGYCLPSKTINQDGSVVETSEILMTEQGNVDDMSIDIKVNRDNQTNTFSGINSNSTMTSTTSSALSSNTAKNFLYNRGEEVYRERFKEIGRANDIREKIALLPGGDLVGFMPLREDFDIEFDNDAEVILADMEFDAEEDHPSERELKLQVIRIYNWKLDERNERKRFVIDRGLVDIKKQQAFEKRLTKEERELVARLRVFSRLHSAEEHEAFVDGLLRARKLRSQIELLQHYRKMGLKTIEQIKRYESERKRRDGERMKSYKPHSGSSLYDSQYESSSSGTGTGTGSYGNNQNMSTTTLVTSSISTSSLVSVSSSSSLPASLPISRRRGRQSKSESSEDFMMEEGSDTKSWKSSREKITETNIDLTRAPGLELLVPIEIEFCSKLPILPLQYLAIKEAIVREAFRNGRLTMGGLDRILNVKASTRDQIYDFFIKSVGINDTEEKKSALYLIPRYYSEPKSAMASSSSSITGTTTTGTGTILAPFDAITASQSIETELSSHADIGQLGNESQEGTKISRPGRKRGRP